MGLKEQFLMYVELQRSANESKIINGPNHESTHSAYDKANKVKREILNVIEELENENL